MLWRCSPRLQLPLPLLPPLLLPPPPPPLLLRRLLPGLLQRLLLLLLLPLLPLLPLLLLQQLLRCLLPRSQPWLQPELLRWPLQGLQLQLTWLRTSWPC
jgi:hypothetical protein